MMKTALFSVLLLAHTGFCTLQDHLKTADGNPDRHSIRNIDFIYMINLDQRPEKWKASLAQLLPYGIEPYRFSAVNGWELSLEDINDVGLEFKHGMQPGIMGTCYLLDGNFEMVHQMIENPGQIYFSHCMSRGAIGISLSHLSILQDAYDKGYETIWVMEDDIEIVQGPCMIPNLIDKLDQLVGEENWDILFTDKNTRSLDGKYVPCSSYSPMPDFKPDNPNRFKTTLSIGEFIKIGARYGTYSMILRRSGIEKILNFYKQHNIFLPYDMQFYLPEDISIYTVKRDVVRHRLDAESDNGIAGYNKD